MQQVSEAYKNEQKQPLREKSYVWVYLGIVDRYAQKNAEFDDSTPVTSWSKVPTGNETVEGVYATYEQNFFRADGSMRFPPEGVWAMYQGAASEGIGGSIKFKFGAACDISGISLKFYDDALPTKFTISNGTVSNTYTYSSLRLDDAGRCKCEGAYENSTYITISPYDSSSLKGGNQRLRIQQILFGIGFFFSNNDLLSTSFTNTVSHLSDQLPSKSFSFTIDNTNKKFSADDPHSFVHFLQEQQEVDFDYGRELPNGNIETIKGGKLYLKTWATDDQKATFNAVGYLDFMDTSYYKGHYYHGYWANQYTLYEYAQEVFDDAGITNYSIDNSLYDFFINTPLPVEKHKNLLQLIANAARCIFFEDRDGTLTIAPAYEGTVENATDYTLEYSDMLTKPKAETTEFVKNVICNYYETYHEEDISQLSTFDAKTGENSYQFSEPVIVDDVCYPERPTTISGIVMDIDWIEDDDTFQFWMEYGYYDYVWEGHSHEEELFDSDFKCGKTYTLKIIDNNGNVVKTETNANHISYKNNTGSELQNYKVYAEFSWYESASNIDSSAAYFVKFNASFRANETNKMLFMGRRILYNESAVEDNIKSIGVDKTCRNILINSKSWAESNRNWMKDYYDDDVVYTVDYRGEPALDCDDVFYMESDSVSKNFVRMIESTINTSQGMQKSTLKARRSSWKDFAKVDYAEVDNSEVK